MLTNLLKYHEALKRFKEAHIYESYLPTGKKINVVMSAQDRQSIKDEIARIEKLIKVNHNIEL